MNSERDPGGRHWATFDCYGTLVDWNGGLREALARLWPTADADELLARYHVHEPAIQESDPGLAYRGVLAAALRAVADEAGLAVSAHESDALATSLPGWPVFPEVRESLSSLREAGWSLAVLSNTDPDLIAASVRSIGVPFELLVTAADAGSYKPAQGHWQRFAELRGPALGQHVHVAGSLFHDIEPAADLGIPAVWINRVGETSGCPRLAELPDLSRLPALLVRLAAGG